MFLHPLVPLLGDGPERRGSSVELGHIVLVTDGPEAPGIRIVGDAFKHHRGGAVGQRSVHDVAVPRDPSDVRRAPEDVIRMVVKDQLMCVAHIGEIATVSYTHLTLPTIL